MLKRKMLQLGMTLALVTACTTTEDKTDAGVQGTVVLRADASAVLEGSNSEVDSGSEDSAADADEDEAGAATDAADPDAGTDAAGNDDAAQEGQLDAGPQTASDDASIDAAGLGAGANAAVDSGTAPDATFDAGSSSLLGTNVALAVAYPRSDVVISKPLSALVSDALEFPSLDRDSLEGLFVAAGDLDVGSSNVTIKYHETITFPTAAFNGYILTFSTSDGLPRIRTASVSPLSSPELQAAVVTYEANVVTINVSGLSITTSSTLVVDVLL